MENLLAAVAPKQALGLAQPAPWYPISMQRTCPGSPVEKQPEPFNRRKRLGRFDRATDTFPSQVYLSISHPSLPPPPPLHFPSSAVSSPRLSLTDRRESFAPRKP